MKTISTAAVSLFACLVMLAEARAQGEPQTTQATSPPVAATALPETEADILLNVFTNALAGLSKFGINLHVESLTLNLNGYAMVGLHNSLNSPDAEQVIVRANSYANTLVAAETASEIEPQPGSSETKHANGSGFTWSNTNLLSVVSNFLSAAKVSGLGFHIGRVTLNLNGYAMVGVTNALDGLTTRQRLTNSAAAQGSSVQAGSPDSQLRPGSTALIRAHSLGEVTLDFNGTAALTLPPSVPNVAPLAPPSP
ncbi:MAG: hypothetical protein KJ070_14430 [Verrucomicrobia bacterium]|nr:hypothetical protein [Verrucomicrobiota bacterium]